PSRILFFQTPATRVRRAPEPLLGGRSRSGVHRGSIGKVCEQTRDWLFVALHYHLLRKSTSLDKDPWRTIACHPETQCFPTTRLHHKLPRVSCGESRRPQCQPGKNMVCALAFPRRIKCVCYLAANRQRNSTEFRS